MSLQRLDHKRLNEKTRQLLDFMKSRVVGQDRALRYIASAFSRMNSKLRNVRKPIGSFLLLGPSGVGKSETARVLAKYLFGDREYLSLIDCTGFGQSHEVARLKGAPPGYVGFKEAGKEPESPYPYLSHYNIYKYHHWQLQEAHKKDIEAIIAEQEKIEDMKKVIDKVMGEIKAIRKELGESAEVKRIFTAKLAELSKAKDLSEDQKKTIDDLKKRIPSLDKDLKKNFDKTKELRTKLEGLQREFYETGVLGDQKIEEAVRKGWLYDSDRPSDELMGIVLFDEIEKADQDLPRHIMEILNTGRFQLDNGEIVPFRNAFVFATSNVGQRQISDLLNATSLGFKGRQHSSDQDLDQKIYEIAMEELKKEFDQEFLNRFDKIVVFHPLGRDSMCKILEIRIEDLIEDLVKVGFPAKLKFDPAVKEFLVNKAMTRTEEGARLLEKRLDSYIRDGLASLEGTGQIAPNDTVTIKMGEREELIFEKEEPIRKAKSNHKKRHRK